MNDHKTHKFTNSLIFQSGFAVTFVLSGLTHTQVALADSDFFQPGNLVVSRVVYDNNANNVTVGMTLPPNCVPSAIITCVTAAFDGTYPTVWNNAPIDGSFGITARIVLDQLLPTTTGTLVNSLEVPQLAKRSPSDQGSDGRQLFVQIRGRSQFVDRRSVPDFYGLPCADQCAGRLEFEYAGCR
jgi:hypothetical protein